MLILDHIGIAVKDIETTLKTFALFGLSPAERGTVARFNVEVCMLPVGDVKLELLQPTAAQSPIAKFIERRGEGLHHIALQVEDISKALTELKSRGFRLVDESARPGFGGHFVAFIHPQSTHGVLIELVEESS